MRRLRIVYGSLVPRQSAYREDLQNEMLEFKQLSEGNFSIQHLLALVTLTITHSDNLSVPLLKIVFVGHSSRDVDLFTYMHRSHAHYA